ncbi:MAG TPA: ABC transporter permease [Bacillota bacterium]|nr:ABC transporter permease [Bacillota bacterium]HPI01642.1 ABC transporter permease [Bacillota bacterium]HPM63771.1 ABC transporter permease [Bacillota bacterium]
MSKYLIRRILITIPVLFGITFIVFAMVSFAPGSAISLMLSNENVNVENVDKLRNELGFDLPWYEQYFRYMGKLLRGDMGRSIQYNRPVGEMIREKIGNTIILAMSSMLVAVVIAIPLGVIAAAKRRSVFDYLATGVALVGVSVPGFYLSLILIIVFGLKLGWLPIRGLPSYDVTFVKLVRHLTLPSITLGSMLAGVLTRLTRASVIEAMSQDYVRTARSKGLVEYKVLFKHALRNALLPVLTTIGMQFGSLLGGAVIIETIFSLPGLGMLSMNAVKFRDIPLIQGTVLVFAVSFVLVMLVVDMLYVLVDPRIRYE